MVWDIQSGSIKAEIHCRELIEQSCLSLSDTHVALVTSSGRVQLYAVDNDDDLPIAPIKQFQIQVLHKFTPIVHTKDLTQYLLCETGVLCVVELQYMLVDVTEHPASPDLRHCA